MNTPTVSIAIPTYNRADLLPFTIESILVQSVENFELIIVDDGSTDDTANVVASFDDHRIRYLRLDTNTGHLSKVRNVGLRAARGEFIAMGDSDDLWRPTYLETQLRLLCQHPEIGFVFCGYERFKNSAILSQTDYRNELQIPGETEPTFVGELFEPMLTDRITALIPATVLRARTLETTGLFNETLPWGDKEFLIRLASHYKAGINHEPLVKIRRHTDNMTNCFEPETAFEQCFFMLEHYRAMGAISHKRYKYLLWKNRLSMGKVLQKLKRDNDARHEFLACARLQPWRYQAYASYLSTAVRRRKQAK